MPQRRTLLPFALAALSLVGVRSAFGQKLPAGPQVLTFFSDVDDSEQPYGLYLPPHFNPHRKYPLVIMLHGAGSNHRLALRRVFGKSNKPGENDVEATRYFPEWKDVDYIVASPLARGTMGYQGAPEKDVYDVLADVERRFPIDPDRVYLTGLSMGGGGTLWVGLSRPDVWAAIAPCCPAPPPGTDELAPNALNYPVHLFQGGADPIVNPAGTRAWVQRLKDLGTHVEYSEYPGVQHNSWENAYKDEFIFKWFSQFRRNRFPEEVRFTTRQYKYDSAYWVHLDALTPGSLTSIDAKFVGPNRLQVVTAGLDGFTLNLAGHPRFRAGQTVEVSIDGKSLTAPGGDAVSFAKRDGAWTAGKVELPTIAKRPGAEGPLKEAASARHIYVYGTADSPSTEELARRRNEAVQAASWGPYTYLRVVADRDVRPSDYDSANLVLFGTEKTNSVLQRFQDRLPLALRDDAPAGTGLLYVFPVGGHYVVVDSGLPWWQIPEPGRRGWRFGSGLPGSSFANDDYVFFNAEGVIAHGLFDNAWKLPEADAGKMRAGGVEER